jgi:hypothetical protein
MRYALYFILAPRRQGFLYRTTRAELSLVRMGDEPELLHLLADLVFVPTEEACSLRYRPRR